MNRHVIPGALLVISALSIASGQYIERHIRLDDPISGANEVYSVAYDSLANAIYVTGWQATLVFDAPTGRKIARMEQYGYWVVSVPEDGKMYVIGESVHVFDARNHTLLKEIPVACRAYNVTPPAAYAPALHKLYFNDHGLLAVVDTRRDSLLGTLNIEHGIWGLCYAEGLNKVYVTNLDGVVAIDCAGDSIISVIPTMTDRYWSQAYSPVSHKLYRGGDDLVVIDCLTDSIIKRSRSPQFFAFMVYNPANNRVYCDYGSSAIVAIDCATDSIVAAIVPPTGFDCLASGLNPVTGRFYFDTGDHHSIIGIVDAVADTFVGTLIAGRHGFQPPYPNFGVDPVNDRVYFTNNEGGTVSVIDGAGDSLMATLVTASRYGVDDLWYDSAADRIIGLDELIGGISFIDAGSCSLAGTKCVAVDPVEGVLNRPRRKVYLADEAYRGIVVVSSETDTTLKRIDCQGGLYSPMALSLGGDKLYARCWVGDARMLVIDCHADSIIGAVNVPRSPSLLMSSAGLNKVFGVFDSTAFFIDGASDSVLRFIPVHRLTVATGYSPAQERWYCIGLRGWQDTIAVIDGRVDSVIGRVYAPGARNEDPITAALWNPLTDCLYYPSGEESCAVFDCRANRAAGFIPVRYARLCDTIRNRIYGITQDSVVVFDGRDNSVIVRLPVSEPGKMAWDPARGCVYVGSGSSTVVVIRDTTVPGILEMPGGTGDADNTNATMIRGLLYTATSSQPDASKPVLLDVSGRRVMIFQSGPNDVRGLSPGVYFIRDELQTSSNKQHTVRKIVITR